MPERYRIVILPEASADISLIFAYIERDSPQNAVSVIKRLMRAIDSLDIFPHRYKVHHSDRNPDSTVHAMPIRPFVLYYRVLENDRVVEILTIRHGARRPPARF